MAEVLEAFSSDFFNWQNESAYDWQKHANLSAYVSIMYAVVMYFTSMSYGAAKSTIGATCFGINAFVDISGSLLIIWRWKGLAPRRTDPKLEGTLVKMVAGLLALLAVTLMMTSFRHLFNGNDMTISSQGFFLIFFGSFFSVFLFFWKRRVGNVLNSLVVQNDAKCSGFAGLNSFVVLVGVGLDAIWKDLAFIDPCVGIAMALLIFSSSAATLADAQVASSVVSGGSDPNVYQTIGTAGTAAPAAEYQTSSANGSAAYQNSAPGFDAGIEDGIDQDLQDLHAATLSMIN